MFVPLLLCSALPPSKETALNAVRAYGYVTGQNMALERIGKMYPSMSGQLLVAKNEFEGEFGESYKNMEHYLKRVFGDKWPDMQAKLAMKFNALYAENALTKADAAQFVALVRKRAKGQIESPILETLLLFDPTYENHPEQEFADGYKYTYRSNGSGKAKGVAFSITVPKTWKAMEANRPNIVQKFLHPGGAMVMVLVKKVPIGDNESIGKEEIAEILKQENSLSALPQGATLIDKGELTLEGLPGYWMKYTMTLSRVRMTMQMETMAYTIFYKNRMIQIQGTNIVSMNGQTVPDAGISKYEKLFDAIVNSLVIDNLYRQGTQ